MRTPRRRRQAAGPPAQPAQRAESHRDKDSYLILGPPRSGKGVHLVIPHTLDAPGAVLVTSTRPDTLRATQQRRAEHGPVLAFDPQQLAADAPRLRWSPTRGCADPLIAINRARALAAGAQLTKGTTSDGEYGDDKTRLLHPDFLFFHQDGDEVVIDIVDPHRHDNADTAPKWAALATYASDHPDHLRRVVAVIRDSSGALRSLDLTAPGIAAKVTAATDKDKIEALFASDGTNY